jgi:DNA-binding CsgD family transcriptional regulator
MRVVGREAETAALAALVPSIDGPSRVYELHGAAGVGKSTMLDAFAAQALDSGARVLRCRPTRTESHLAYAGLSDLLAPVPDLSMLSPVLRTALDVALLRSAPDPSASGDGSVALDARVVGSACVGVWEALCQQQPLALIIDDVQWLDAASAAALAFSVRRLPAAGVAVLCGRRSGETGPQLATEGTELLPLGADAVMTLLNVRDDVRAARLTARQMRNIVEGSGGNPFFALELAREAVRRGTSSSTLVVPRSVEDALAIRFDALPGNVVDALVAVALLAKPDLAVVRRLEATAAIAQAEREDIVDTASGRVVFRHPLLASAVLGRCTPSALRLVHRSLVDLVDDPVQSARHAALAAEEPSAALAAELEDASRSLIRRGAIEHAAEFAVLAARLSPLDSADRHGRFVTAAHLAFQSGDGKLAEELLAETSDSAADAPTRVRELLVRTKVGFSTGVNSAAFARQALELCTTDVERVEVHSILARVEYDNFDLAYEHAQEAHRLAQGVALSPAERVSVAVASAGAKFMTGGGLDRAMFEEAMALERLAPGYVGDSAEATFAVLLKTADELDESREMLLRMLRTNDDDGAVPFVLSHLPQLELWSGNWPAAEEYAHQHLEAAIRTGQHEQAVQARNNLVVIDVWRGDTTTVAATVEESLRNAVEAADAWNERSALGLLGLIALNEGDAEAAVRHLARWEELSEQMGLRDPGYSRMQPDYVEALVATGRLDEAAKYASAMLAMGQRLGRAGCIARAQRVSALVCAAQGNRDAAVELAQAAVAGLALTPLVVDHARAQLTLGQVHRRFKEKSAARTALSAALAEFERLGAQRLAERARQDLARVGLRAPASDSLTETERRVAMLAATGRTVRHIGDELFISPKTVEANLTRVYRKLGLSGRAELARWAAEAERAPSPR